MTIAEINEKLAEATTLFSQNVLADESGFHLVLSGPAELAGLPDFVIDSAKAAAMERRIENAHVITLSRSLVVPFLTFSTRRDLREKVYRAWMSRGEGLTGADKTMRPLRDIMALRQEQASLLLCQFRRVRHRRHHGRISGRRSRVLAQVEPGQARMNEERAALQAIADREAPARHSRPGTGAFYAEKVRLAKYALDNAELKPYFSLERMTEAAFDCASRLFGLTFTARPDIAAYHPDVQGVRSPRRRKAEGDFPCTTILRGPPKGAARG